MKKVFFTLLVLVVCCSFVVAFPSKASYSGSSNEKLWSEAIEESSLKSSEATKQLLKDLESNSKATKKELSKGISQANELVEDYENQLKKIHYYVDGGMIGRVQDKKAQLGFVVGGGIRILKDVRVGAQMQIFCLNTPKDSKFLDNTTFAITAGYEF